ncbi:MAG: VOC family protein [Pirellulaceae bacterium]|nr:VOC family protein [Pirellulaceae bacterium]
MVAIYSRLRFVTVALALALCVPPNGLGAQPPGRRDARDARSQATIEPADYHHTRINTVDPTQSMQFYETIVNAQRISYRGSSNAVLVDRALILFNTVSQPPPWQLESGLYHIGWGCKDAVAEFEWLRKHQVEIETPPRALGQHKYLYAFGPSREFFEFYSGIPQPRFAHVHLITHDVGATAQWYMDNLGLRGPSRIPPRPSSPPDDFEPDPNNPLLTLRYMWMTELRTADDVRINIFAAPGHGSVNWWTHAPTPPETLLPSAGRALDHIAFSFRDIQPVRDRMQSNGVQIIDDIKLRTDFGFKSFYVLGPDHVTIEIVEEKPIPEGSWE